MKLLSFLFVLLLGGCAFASDGQDMRRRHARPDGDVVIPPQATTTATSSNITPGYVIFDGHGTLWQQWHNHFLEAFALTWYQAPNQDKLRLLAVLYDPQLWKNIRTARREVFDLFIDDISAGIPVLQEHRAQFISNYNHHELNPGMVELVEELRQQGHRIILGSNIGVASLTKLLKRRPEIDMDGYCIVQSDHDKDSIGALKIFTGEKSLVRSPEVKPSTTYFGTLKQIAPHGAFVDDRKDIVDAASANGFDAVIAKSADQVRKDLQELRYLPENKKIQ